MSNEMVERVAKAIKEMNYVFTRDGEFFEYIAKIAIEAMREPIEAMLDAGAYDLDMTLEMQYKNMIDAALKDG